MTLPLRLLRLSSTEKKLLDKRTGTRGEIYYDNTNQTLRIFDGELLGGRGLLLDDLSNLQPGSLPPTVVENAHMTFGHTVVMLGSSTNSLVGLDQVQAFNFIGNTNGQHYGDVVGNITGNITIDGVTSTGATGTGQIVFDTSPTISGAAISNAVGMNFSSGALVTEFSSDNTLSGNSDSAVPTEAAVKGYVDAQAFYVGTTQIGIARASAAQTLNGVSISGNAGTVTNGVYDNQTYSNPSWITSLALSKVGLTVGKSFDYNASSTPALNVKATAATVDFGTQPVTSKSFTITDANSTVGNTVVIYPVGDDEWEMDPIAYSAKCNAGTITVYASTSQGPVKGTRSLRYVLV